jgi:hypothetical protein
MKQGVTNARIASPESFEAVAGIRISDFTSRVKPSAKLTVGSDEQNPVSLVLACQPEEAIDIHRSTTSPVAR